MYILNMDIKTFIDSNSKSTADKELLRQKIADYLGVSVSTVKSWANGNRNIPPKRWAKLRRISGGKITNLRSDLHDEDIAV